MALTRKYDLDHMFISLLLLFWHWPGTFIFKTGVKKNKPRRKVIGLNNTINYATSSGLKMGMENNIVWVWNRVRVLRTVRHTPNQNFWERHPSFPLPPPSYWGHACHSNFKWLPHIKCFKVFHMKISFIDTIFVNISNFHTWGSLLYASLWNRGENREGTLEQYWCHVKEGKGLERCGGRGCPKISQVPVTHTWQWVDWSYSEFSSPRGVQTF